MEYKNIFEELVDRGYFEQATYEDELKELLSKERVKFYIGFDATADSLTIGHFIQIMVMKRMQNYGHIPIALLGGGTTMIGDPSGRSDMRMVMTEEQINHNAQRFFEQLSRFIDFSDGNAIIENNKDWLLDLNFIKFMKEVGVHFSVNKMLTCDAYKNRMEKGLTFFEFSYMLMQSYDFLYLYRKHGCKLQLGGSDQWSNILGGYDLVRKLEQDKVYAMTFKLLTTADGVKMGKSQKGAVWLDEEKTSPYELFQYMRNVDDRDVEKFLLMLTFLPTETQPDVMSVEKLFFTKNITTAISVAEARGVAILTGRQADLPIYEYTPNEIKKSNFENEEIGILDLIRTCGLSKSNGEARRLIEQGGISLNGEKVADTNLKVSLNLEEIVIKKGKKIYRRVIAL